MLVFPRRSMYRVEAGVPSSCGTCPPVEAYSGCISDAECATSAGGIEYCVVDAMFKMQQRRVKLQPVMRRAEAWSQRHVVLWTRQARW